MRPRLRRIAAYLRGRHGPLLVEPTPYTADEKARLERNEAALRLVDDDTFGYIVIRLRKPQGSFDGRIEVEGHVMPEWWPPFRETLSRVQHAGGEFFPD